MADRYLYAIHWVGSMRGVDTKPSGSYCQIWCTAGCSCGGLAVLDELYSVVELDALDDLCELAESAEPAPGFLRASSHLVDHREHGLAGDAALGSRAAVSDRGEGRLDDVGRSKMRPVGSGDVVEREQFVDVVARTQVVLVIGCSTSDLDT